MKRFFILILLVCCGSALSQNLTEERIRKIVSHKRSIFLNGGIFHGGEFSGDSTQKAVRHGYDSTISQERVVFDFATEHPPKFYGYIDGDNKKMYIDFYNTKLMGETKSFGNSRYVEGIDFFPITRDSLSVEVHFKESISVDIFYLASPGRFVVDVKV